MTLWCNGQLLAIEGARIDPRDRGFTLGDGLYETIRVREGRLLRVDRHFARLGEGLKLLDIRLKVDENALTGAMLSVLKDNGLTGDAVLRLTVSRGVAARGMAADPTARPTVVISATPYTAPQPARVMVATVTRRNALSPISRVKTTSCLDSILARQEATRHGADDAILLNGEGWVAEATAANVFAVIDGVLVTPPIRDGALPGVMRAAVMSHLPLGECSLSVDDLARAGEIFLTSSLGIRPVVRFETVDLPVGPIASRLIEEL
ncbi:MAG TPA: aminotransferase class IV [Alphaproteobacteria bacterium]|jgi:branched-chain amino acid aminotransferase|nr:aminotransferase class IV [Alphaproteobacteria bacterium]